VVCTFTYTGNAQYWTVPDGVSQATFDVYGAQGGSAGGAVGGRGGEASATIAVTPGETLQVNVGGRGGAGLGGTGAAGGFNGGAGGGNGSDGGGGGGGGASDVRSGAFGLANRIIVGGGSYGGGGGGGSGFGPSGVVFERGVRLGNGLVTITYTPNPKENHAISVSHTGANANGWNNSSPVTLNVSASDTGSGLERLSKQLIQRFGELQPSGLRVQGRMQKRRSSSRDQFFCKLL